MLKGKILDSSKKPLNIILSDTISDLWHGFPDLKSKEVNIYTFFSGLSGTTLLRLSNSQPLGVLHRDSDENLWLIMGTSIGISSCNNLCETGFYVPFLDRVCRYLCKAIDSTEEKWIAGKEIKNPWYQKRYVQIITVDNKPISQPRENTFIIEEPGIYKIIPEGEKPFLKAVVPDSSESKLKYRLPSFKNDKKKLRVVKTAAEIVSYLRKSDSKAISFFLWLLLITFIGIELYLRKKEIKGKEFIG